MGFIEKHKFAVGAGVVVLGLFAFMKLKGEHRGGTPMGHSAPVEPTLPLVHSAFGYTGPGAHNIGWDNLDNQVNQTPTAAAGGSAGLDPSAFSYLTQRNENFDRNGLKHSLPKIPLTGGPARSFEHQRFQGTWGLTGPPGQGFFTYY